MERLHLIPPETSASNVIGCNVGLRPYRKNGPRIEREDLKDKIFYHNYGHGGAGVSIGYGCSKYIVTRFVADFGNTIKKVAIIGSGYMGLFQASLLADLGYQVTIYADNFPLKFGVYSNKDSLTSQVAGGLWMPYGYDLKNRPLHDVTAKDTWEHYEKCIATNKYKGLSYKKVVLMGNSPNFVNLYVPPGLIKDFREVDVTFGNGVYYPAKTFTTILMDGDLYLNELVDEAKAKGVTFVEKSFKSFEDILKLDDKVIFNCTGNGAAVLFGDQNMNPVKGQLVYMKKPDGFNYFFQTSTKDGWRVTTYPQGNKQAIGLSYEEGVKDTKPDPKILERLRKNMEDFFADKIIRPKL